MTGETDQDWRHLQKQLIHKVTTTKMANETMEKEVRRIPTKANTSTI